MSQSDIDAIIAENQKLNSDIQKANELAERNGLQRDAAERLLKLTGKREVESTSVTTRSNGSAPANWNPEAEVDAIVNSFTAEQLQDPETLKKLMRAYGIDIVQTARKAAIKDASEFMNQVTSMHTTTMTIIEKFKKDNADIIDGGVREKLCETMLLQYVAKDPDYKDATLAVKLNKAAEMTREELKKLGAISKEEQEAAQETIDKNKTLTPTKASAGSSLATGTRTTTTSEGDPEKDVDTFLARRREIAEKKMHVTY